MKIFPPVKVPPELKPQYEQYCARHNIVMFLPLAVAILIAEIIILVFQIIRLKDRLYGLLYFDVYVLAIIISLFYTVVYALYRCKKLKKGQKAVDFAFILSFLGMALLTTAAETESLVTLPDLIILTSYMIAVATLVHFHYLRIIFTVIFGYVGAIIITLMSVNSPNANFLQDHVFTVFLNILFTFLAITFACIPSYNNRTTIFLQEVAIAKANENLKRSNFKLLELNKQLEKTSMTDALTKVSNRQAFDSTLSVRWQAAAQAKEPLSVLMVDIDFFKKYNDTFGHLAGDECLKEVASLIKKCIRHGVDNVFRYGGEEFVVLLPDSDVHGAKLTAERLQKDIENANIKHITELGSVTLSIGIHCETPTHENDYSLIEKADIALYYAKSNGRNQCVVYNDSMQNFEKTT